MNNSKSVASPVTLSGETSQSILLWADEAFGKLPDTAAGTIRMFDRADEEMRELRATVNSVCRYEDIVEEAADVVICLHRLAASLGLDLTQFVNQKMAKNRLREWEPDGTGCGYHVAVTLSEGQDIQEKKEDK